MFSSPIVKRFPLFIAVAFLSFTACKKDKSDPVSDKESLLKDSVYLYTKEVYLWQDALPSSFQPRQYDSAENVLEALKQYKKDSNGDPIDRYSFIDREGSVSGEIQEGVLGDFGFDIRYEDENDLRVKLVYQGSPADLAGIKRSWKILKINGNSNIGYAAMQSDGFNFLYSALGGSSITLSLQKDKGIKVKLVCYKISC